ncbi:glycine cleavage system aminomethyltransferase GcvT [Candidatus Nitrosacidococcus sp. I8]|uniref:glycine cleavage system aminomethyltransferase GcvT n=1 Tax=Candidatus Nitrosacidococcus sp. I8 TaxID=2942908 RepID=UPI0022275716|nr:glycine cleavage system aminomethyltransferase GcvT [Candidatus Nitrosacidococcus sp. I8]CAH9019924.1 Aminomethyltransferase [Candidatus Nitrosacidococcus sp. I8]
MEKHTSLFDLHCASNAHIVDFAGWEMPLHYGSQVAEHHHVRRSVGIFDVSHMVVTDLKGENVRSFLRYLLANNIDRLNTPGAALYSCMLNEHGGVIDDIIAYFISEEEFRIVSNAGTRDKDLAWFKSHGQSFGVSIIERSDLAMIAIQGPEARDRVHDQLSESIKERVINLKRFHGTWEEDFFIARTGYTGEDGYELLLPAIDAPNWWQKMINHGVTPCGLGSRDTLRLEAGMCLYGTDMDESTTPFESGLGWTVALKPTDRDFIGRKVLEQKIASTQQVGLLLLGKGLLRNRQPIATDLGEGMITSGGFSPTLSRSIALANVPIGASCCEVDIRGKKLIAEIIKPPFVRQGKSCLSDELLAKSS